MKIHPARFQFMTPWLPGLLVAFALGPAALGTATVTFTATAPGTHPGTFRLDSRAGLLTVDLSALPADAELFRAELMLVPITSYMQKRPVAPTRVFVEGQPERSLPFVAPRFVSLDVLEPVRSAVKSGQPLRLRVETTCQGVERLEVSGIGLAARRKAPGAVRELRVTHRAGQSLVVFAEPALEPMPACQTGADVRAFVRRLQQAHKGVTFRIWRSPKPITPSTIAAARLVGECGWFTGWNAGYHQDDTDKKPPLRYRVTDGGPEVPWGAGIYAHNPGEAGAAHYAVTVAMDGEEDFAQLGGGNTTTTEVVETVGLGAPVLQWKETMPEWQYRQAPAGGRITRLIYTRWESWPNAARPSVPIDYVVVSSTGRREGGEGVGETTTLAQRVEPAPVGLHLHCWGGSLNGGYGWWHNAHRGAVLFAANQVPYDWWTGYHEAIGTCKTWADGHVQPFTMNRLFAFLDWASRQWQEVPETVRADWPRLDLHRVFAAGTSMGGSGAPMYAIRHGDRIAWALGWVGVHVPELSPQFKGSYEQMYGPLHLAISMPDGQTSPWDYFNDVRWLRQDPRRETGLVIASNGKNDGAIGWPQAVAFARALQETRRPHIFNWGLDGHGTRTLIGANFDQEVRTDQTLPAFTRGSLDGNIGTGTPRSPEAIESDKRKQAEDAREGRRKEIVVDPYDGDSAGAYNAWLRWDTGDIVDELGAWELTVRLLPQAPRDTCTVDLTPRRTQRFRSPSGRKFDYTVTDLQTGKRLGAGQAKADEAGLLTLPQIPLAKGRCRVKITPAR